MIRAAAEAGADYVFANPLFLKPCSAAVFLPFLEQNFPHLAENYRQRYQDRAFLPPAYGKRLSHLVAHLREKYKMTRAHRRERLRLRHQVAGAGFRRAVEPVLKIESLRNWVIG